MTSNYLSCDHVNAVKNGKDDSGRQRYKCANCGKSFTKESMIHPELRRKKRLASQLLLLGYLSDEIESTMSVSIAEVDLWSKKYLPKLQDIKKTGKLLEVNNAYKYLSALDKGRRPERINKNKSSPRKPRPKKTTRIK